MNNANHEYHKKLLVVIHKVEDWLLVIAISAMVLFSCLQIVLRNLFESGIAWISPLLGVLLIWVGLLGALVATRQHAHIKINVLSALLPEKFANFAQLIVNLFSALVLFVVAYYCVEFIKLDFESSTVAFGHVPVWISETVLPVTFALMGLRFLVQAVTSLLKAIRRSYG